MRWEDERYVRSYTRDTAGWLMMPWQGRAVQLAILRKLDRAGVLDLAEYADEEMDAAVGVVVGLPQEVVAVGLAALLKRKTFVLRGQYLVMPNYIEAQECAQSDKHRKAEQRSRYREQALAAERGLVAEHPKAVLDLDDVEQPSSLPRTSVVYFVQSEGGGPIKIGYASDLRERLWAMNTGRPDRLTVLASFPGRASDEKELHKRFASARKSGEWFEPTSDLLAFIADVTKRDARDRIKPQASQPVTAGHSDPCLTVPNRAESDARAQDPSPPKSGVFKSSPPPKLEPVIAEPERHAAASLTPQATESGYDLAWRLWRGAWEAKYRDEYDRGPELGITSDHKVLQRIGVLALARADPEALLAHKFAGYLRDHGVKGYLDEHRHPLRCIERDWNKYGEPRKPRQAMPPPKPEPVGVVLSPEETMARVKLITGKIGRTG